MSLQQCFTFKVPVLINADLSLQQCSTFMAGNKFKRTKAAKLTTIIVNKK